jgi:hypothetical protein
MARTNKEIQKEIEELREIDRITTIKINQEFADLKQQEKKQISYNDFKNNCKFCNDRIYNSGYCDRHCKRYDKENQEKEKAKLNDLFDSFFQSQVKTIKLLNNK